MNTNVTYCFATLMCLCLIWPQIAKCQSDTDKDAALELTQNRLIKVLGEVVITGPLPSNHADSAYLVLKQKLEKKNFLVRKLAHFLTPSCTMEPVKNSDFESSEFYFANFEGHPIRNIVIKKIAVFGTDMNDSTKHPFLLVDRLGNKIHYNTRDFVIRNNLLVKKGDRVNPYQMAYNEHVIRELPFIQDVKFELVRASVLSDSVDLVVKTKDMWSIGINYEPYNLNEHRLTISNQNLFGLGRTLTTKLLMKEHNAIGIGNKYSIGNFYGLFLNIELELENSFERRYGGITFDRSILNPGIKWLYGGGIKREEMNNNIVFEGNEFPNFQLDFQNYDLWFGYVKKKQNYPNKSVNANTIFSLRASYLDYNPLNEVISGYDRFDRNKLVLGSITLQEQQFFHTKLVSTYDRTEDIPFGRLVSFIGGMRISSMGTQPYLGFRMSKGSIVNSWYAGADMQFGSFFNDKGMEEGIFKVELSNVSPLFEKKKMKYRQFIKLAYTQGINRLGYDSISLNENGIRGMNSELVSGTKRLTLNSETVFFLNKRVMSFKFAIFTFADLGLISNQELFKAKNMYSCLGIGLRVRNENLIFKTIQLHLAWYPHHPADVQPLNFIVRGIDRWQFNQFGFTPPAVLDFN